MNELVNDLLEHPFTLAMSFFMVGVCVIGLIGIAQDFIGWVKGLFNDN